MKIEEELIFPELIFLDDYRGNFDLFFNAVYQIFETDFIKTQEDLTSVLSYSMRRRTIF